MNLLVTGVNGLVGKAIARELLAQKYNIIGISKARENKSGLPIEYCSLDISESNSFNVLKEKRIDAIIHCAASLDTDSFSEELIDTNCMGIRNVAAFALEQQCKQFIYISSSTVIGNPVQIPITEDHPVDPNIVYQLTKYFGEMYLKTTLKNINLAVFRIPSPLGIDLKENKIIPTFIKKSIKNEDITLSGSGARVQNYIDVQDIGIATHLAIQNNVAGIYNIASEKSYSNKEVAEMCIQLFNSKSNIIYVDIDLEESNKWIISVDKAKHDFNFQARISLADSMINISQRYI